MDLQGLFNLIMQREIIFRRAHFDLSGKFICFTYWGKIDHKDKQDDRCFKSPSNVSGCHTSIDDQFTGLKDKNGKNIFEGDFDQNYDVVSWCENRNGYSLFTYDYPTKQIIYCCCYCYSCEGNYELNENIDNIEIIGNIHDLEK
jgi:hypothetical protein